MGGLPVPSLVRVSLGRMDADLEEAISLLRGARDLEWVSDAADLFLLHLDRMTESAARLRSRISMAETAMRSLEGAG